MYAQLAEQLAPLLAAASSSRPEWAWAPQASRGCAARAGRLRLGDRVAAVVVGNFD